MTNIINFYYLIIETKTNLPSNGYHTQNINIVARDLDAQYINLDGSKEIENLENEIKSLKTWNKWEINIFLILIQNFHQTYQKITPKLI